MLTAKIPEKKYPTPMKLQQTTMMGRNRRIHRDKTAEFEKRNIATMRITTIIRSENIFDSQITMKVSKFLELFQ